MKKLIASLALFLFLFISPTAVFAANKCCPGGYTRCDKVQGNDITACGDKIGSEDYCGKFWFESVVVPHTDRKESHECNITCEWVADTHYPTYCFGGFTSESDFKNFKGVFECKENCGAWGTGAIYDLLGKGKQEFDLSGPFATDPDDGTYYTCKAGVDYAQGYNKVVDDCVNPKIGVDEYGTCAASVVGGAALTLIPGLHIGGIYALKIAIGGCAVSLGSPTIEKLKRSFQDITKECQPTIEGRIESGGTSVCSQKAGLGLDPQFEDRPDDDDDTKEVNYQVCRQVAAASPEQGNQCCTCMTGSSSSINPETGECDGFTSGGKVEGLWTAVGCVKTDQNSIVKAVVLVGLSISGGIVLLMMVAGGFILSTSRGDPKQVTQAKDMITSAITGLLIILFSVVILRFIGVTIFNIPGFGST